MKALTLEGSVRSGRRGAVLPGRTVAAVIVGALVLFLWHGVSQVFPWGTAVVRNHSATSGATYVASTNGLRREPPGTWTTPAFENDFGGGVSTLATDRSFSWVISVPSSSYSLPRFFASHALNQLLVALLLLCTGRILKPLSKTRRMLTILALGVTITVGTYGEMLNWMGMPAAYSLGQIFNHVVGLVLGFAVIDRVASPTVTTT